ncbi:hypothetical protein LPH44_12055 (plasmid) [Xylella taiwanensis]|nr:hypothetical protein [Xylella taiwanensis]UFN08028.1 hypothetical protein LPH42_12075 [Xylella taiwanensis]UFN10321.1 hypothetical protein LPH45_12080 [Xylella taiwanensis]UFN12609.1 hypothetical protein LPH44_12055 [Xylella taiwanensis]UFN14902.1 hypothetical protein LPH61_12075 [Xylella taiwanensis]UFN42530.1 hypothetical protein LPH57_12090 [Xylella taiwanensis]
MQSVLPKISDTDLADMFKKPVPPQDEEIAALKRLVAIAKRGTHQSGHVADFLLSWWNTDECGGFDMRNLWGVDRRIAEDMVTVFGLVARIHVYPPQIDRVFDADFDQIVRLWRPKLFADA